MISAPLTHGSVNSTVRKVMSHSITGLKRWSISGRDLPPISQIKALHVYDFDNTLFSSPLPNPKLWTAPTVSFLQTQDCFVNGGWWHDQHILEATGEGVENEEPRAWEGWWNEHIVALVNLSLKQTDALTVLLTGRGENNFADIIRRIVSSKKLPFDLICLKPRAGPNNQIFSSTMAYKQAFLKDLVYTYKDADEIRLYEDRVKHTKVFREFFENFNKSLLSLTAPTPRKTITADVVQVAELATSLDPVTETAEVQRMVNVHNDALNSEALSVPARLEIKRTVFFTGYLIPPADTAKLLTLVTLPPGIPESEVKFLANTILITPHPCPASKLEKIGGIGHKQMWKISGAAVYESKIWAARVTPVPPLSVVYTENSVPIVVLAHFKGARPVDANRIQNWQPVASGKEYVFETVVGEKMQLRVEREVDGETEYEGLFPHRGVKRRIDEPRYEGDSYRPSPHNPRNGYSNDENRRPGNSGNYRGGNQNRNRGAGNGPGGGQHRHVSHANGRGGRGGGGGGGGGNRGRGRGSYKSLDDVGTGNSRYGWQGNGYPTSQQPNYDDGPSSSFAPGTGEPYHSAFPALGGGGSGGREHNGASHGDGGLPYGK